MDLMRIMRLSGVLFGGLVAAGLTPAAQERAAESAAPLRLIIETDAGGDPDDEQSLVRFLLYANEWDVEGIIANRPVARAGENQNPERTGLGIVRALVHAYGECQPRLQAHDARYPTEAYLQERTLAGDNDSSAAVELLMAAVDRPDPRPLWYSDWGTDNGAAVNNLRRALDRVLRERGPEGYARFKSKLRLVSSDAFGEHTDQIDPPFPLWVDTWRPELNGKRWYWQFAAITARAGGFDLERDCRTGHGPLGALYPTNTTHPQKEGDSASFIYLLPVGLGDPSEPTWGSWAGRYGRNETFPDRPYYWASLQDQWEGTTTRDNTLARWATALQNDFRARLNWCVKPFDQANHPPSARVAGEIRRTIPAGAEVALDASPSSDPDAGQSLSFRWELYREPGTFGGDLQIRGAAAAEATLTAPQVAQPVTLHLVLTVTDSGSPPLSRYRRVIVTVVPQPSKVD